MNESRTNYSSTATCEPEAHGSGHRSDEPTMFHYIPKSVMNSVTASMSEHTGRTNPVFNVAIRVGALREGISLKELAYRAGIPKTTFDYRIQDRKAWNLDQLSRIGSVLFDDGFKGLLAQAIEECRKVGVII